MVWWVYRDKNQEKTIILLIHYCNCWIELGKCQAKHQIFDKQRDTLILAFLQGIGPPKIGKSRDVPCYITKRYITYITKRYF